MNSILMDIVFNKLCTIFFKMAIGGRTSYVRFLSLAATVCNGENCTTIIIKLLVILGQFGSYLCNVL